MKLNLFCPLNTLSYGYVSCYVLKELTDLGVEISLHPIGPIQPEDKFIPYIQKGLAKQKLFFHEEPCLKIFHQNCLEQWVGNGDRVAFPIFELNKFNEIEKHHLDSYNVDKIIVCSEWAKTIVKQQIQYATCSVVPLGVDTSVFTPKVNRRKTTVFFNCGKWEVRKGHDILVDLFNRAFTADSDVELWIMPGNGYLKDGEDQQWKQKYTSSYLGRKIRFIEPVQNQDQAAYIMQQTDCGIFPSRAEGWGMPILEMMACGKYIITTNYSGQTQFCTKDNSFLVDINQTELARDNKWFTDGEGEWASLTDKELDAMVVYMQHMHQYKQAGISQNEAGIQTANKFTWRNTGNELLKVLEL